MDFKHSILILINLCLLISAFNCTSKCYKEVSFSFPIEIYPVKATYNQGDTVWLEVKLPYTLKDQKSNENILVGPYPFKIHLNIIELLEDTFKDGLNSVQLLEETGKLDTLGDTYSTLELEFQDYANDKYQLNRFALIPKEAGKQFQISFYKVNYSGDWSGVKHFPQDDCDYAIDESVYITNGGSIDYAHVLSVYPYVHNPSTSVDTISNLKNAGTFFIRVQ